MSLVYFISDLHLGHKNILNFEPGRGGSTVDEHDEWIVRQWNSIVKPRDTVWVLGDVCMNRSKLPLIGEMNGQKRLVLGNHDVYSLEEYSKYFYKIHALLKYKGFWISHAPIHPTELRGRKNIHGHVHSQSLPDSNYINVSVEMSDGVPQLFTELLEKHGFRTQGYDHENAGDRSKRS